MISWAEAKRRIQLDVIELGGTVTGCLLAELPDVPDAPPDTLEALLRHRADMAWRPA